MSLTVTTPEPDRFDIEDAEEVVHLARDVETGEVSSVYVDLNDPFLTRGGARAIAARLLALADEWDRTEARPRLRRLPDVDEELRRRDV
ncbi:hypothetical protein [Microbacterium testaceum]|uniref:hypothetical protein n=1 Tax=Microbacterium testaceum TaxID=2033 RepID=UPI0022E34E85|nr:hypothetical protein [Microbacterium testaceum]